jgi:hypothetical protein
MSELTYPAQPTGPERPKAVTVIGGIWLVLAAASLFKTAVNFIFWEALKPAIPSLVALAARQEPTPRFLNPILEHYGVILAVQAVLAAAVGTSAYFLLRLRPWARLAVQTVCVVCFSIFWLTVLSRSSARPRGPLPTAVGIAAFTVLAAGLAVTIGVLRSRRVRAAFVPASSPPPPR